MAAVLKAACDKLRQDLPIPEGKPARLYVDIQPAGSLPPAKSQWFVALDEGGVSSKEKISLSEEFSIEVTIWKEASRYAPDRLREMYLDNSPGLDALERNVIASLHNVHEVRRMACENAGAPGVVAGDIFQTPLWYQGRGKTRLADVALERTLLFRGCRRVQAVDVMN